MKQSQFKNVLVPILSVILALIFGAVVILIIGKDPIEAYGYLFSGALGTPFGIGQTIRSMSPLILTALAFSVASKAGFFNIGLPGQALAGWLTSVWVALSFPDLPQMILLPLCIFVGILAGALWAGIAGVLRAYFHSSEVITTIMLNYIIVYLTDFLVRNVLTNPPSDATPNITKSASLRLEFLTELTEHSTVHSGILISLIAAFAIHFMFKKTTFGFEIRSIGLNRHAAQYAGVNTKRTIVYAMLLSGGLAGLAGVMEGLGQFESIFLMKGAAPSIGWDGMAVALLALGHPIGIIFSSLLFAIFESGRAEMSLMTNVPFELVSVITAVIIFFVGANYVIRFVLDKFSKKEEV